MVYIVIIFNKSVSQGSSKTGRVLHGYNRASVISITSLSN